jgi:hypothetical protein
VKTEIRQDFDFTETNRQAIYIQNVAHRAA